jgi:glucose-6-phosphate-specific signal transduction histidine kinase
MKTNHRTRAELLDQQQLAKKLKEIEESTRESLVQLGVTMQRERLMGNTNEILDHRSKFDANVQDAIAQVRYRNQ